MYLICKYNKFIWCPILVVNRMCRGRSCCLIRMPSQKLGRETFMSGRGALAEVHFLWLLQAQVISSELVQLMNCG